MHRYRNTWVTFRTILLLVSSTLWASVSNAITLPPRSLQRRDPIGGGVDLRVLPIGDSITWGAQSSDSNGYRNSLFNQLAARGNKVDFVGNVTSGSMADNQHEGHRGYVIAEIAAASNVGIYAAPNIALLHAGTNDMNRNVDVGTAPSRLKSLIDKIFAYSPDAVVLVCQIIPSTTTATQARINAFNAEIPSVVSGFVEAGKKVIAVEMNKALTTADLKDNLHPNDIGYSKMADAYYAAIEKVDDMGWISKPGSPNTNPSGDFKPSWAKRGVIAEGACPRARLHFMDLNGDGLKDYACVDLDTGATKVHLNIPDSEGKASGKWKALGTIATGKKGRKGSGVMFADLNGDGRDDYIYVDPGNGDVYGWINRLEKNGVWQWQSIGRIAGGVGATNSTLQMVDLDGDGRDDFCLVNQSTGEVTAWLNTGANIVPDYQKLGVIATGASASEGDTVVLGDFTGEGRANYMIVGPGGKVNGLINNMQTTTLVPRWSKAFSLAEGPDSAEQDQVRLVDLTGDGKVDYLLVDEKTGKVSLWENKGTRGRRETGWFDEY